jgi:hypothetical protein
MSELLTVTAVRTINPATFSHYPKHTPKCMQIRIFSPHYVQKLTSPNMIVSGRGARNLVCKVLMLNTHTFKSFD